MDLVQALNKIDALRTKRDAITFMMNDQIEILGKQVEAYMKEHHLDKQRGDKCLAYFSKHRRAEVQDWDKFTNFIFEKKALDLLEKRVSVTAIELRTAAGEVVPGVSLSDPDYTLVIRQDTKK